MSSIHFDSPDLARAVEALGPEGLDSLPFGVIRLDEAGTVVVYNRTEAEQSGSGSRPRLGRDFFREIAPCMNTDSFRGRIERAMGAGTLDAEFTHMGDFADRDRELTVRLQSAAGGGVWIFHRREG